MIPPPPTKGWWCHGVKEKKEKKEEKEEKEKKEEKEEKEEMGPTKMIKYCIECIHFDPYINQYVQS